MPPPVWKRCCCCSVKTFVISYLIWILLTGGLIHNFKQREADCQTAEYLYTCLIILNAIGTVLLFVGVVMEKANLIMYFIVVDLVVIISMYVACVLEDAVKTNGEYVCAVPVIISLLCLFGVYSYYVELSLSEL